MTSVSKRRRRSPAPPTARPAAPTAGAVTLGIDLRSGPRYPTGLAALDRRLRLLRLCSVRSDEEIDDAVGELQPALIAIDAPLALPEGRCCADPRCECAAHGIMREVDRACAAAGYHPFPTLLPSMVKLTLRGIALRERLTAAGHQVIEVYPGMAQDILGIPRKQAGTAALANGLRRRGIRGIPRKRPPTHDELDAATCALVAAMHIEHSTETMGPADPAPFVLPARHAG